MLPRCRHHRRDPRGQRHRENQSMMGRSVFEARSLQTGGSTPTTTQMPFDCLGCLHIGIRCGTLCKQTATHEPRFLHRQNRTKAFYINRLRHFTLRRPKSLAPLCLPESRMQRRKVGAFGEFGNQSRCDCRQLTHLRQRSATSRSFALSVTRAAWPDRRPLDLEQETVRHGGGRCGKGYSDWF